MARCMRGIFYLERVSMCFYYKARIPRHLLSRPSTITVLYYRNIQQAQLPNSDTSFAWVVVGECLTLTFVRRGTNWQPDGTLRPVLRLDQYLLSPTTCSSGSRQNIDIDCVSHCDTQNQLRSSVHIVYCVRRRCCMLPPLTAPAAAVCGVRCIFRDCCCMVLLLLERVLLDPGLGIMHAVVNSNKTRAWWSRKLHRLYNLPLTP